MQEGPLQRYRQMVQVAELAPDTAQELAAEKLQLLANRLAQYSELRFGDLFPFAGRRRSAPEGLYLYGGVGRGKTMLLDLSRLCITRRNVVCTSRNSWRKRMRRSSAAARPPPTRSRAPRPRL